ncbi:MAG: hypothetical protein Q8J78_08245 [Moraxellaceae bacterium]|nr:hypothetical protein [Moraxellaceae bacterium]
MSTNPLPPEDLPPTSAGRLSLVMFVLFVVLAAVIALMLVWGIADPTMLLKVVATFVVVALTGVIALMALQPRS